VAEGEYNNAKDIYGRVYAEFKNMPKVMREALTEEEKGERLRIMTVLSLNLALCMHKKGMPKDTVKFAKEAIDHDPNSAKAYYRLF